MNNDTKIKCAYCGALVDKTNENCPECCAPLKQANSVCKPCKTVHPSAIASLVLGILSINFSSLIIPGFILSAIGKRKANEGYEAIAADPEAFTGEGMLNAGRITSKVGLIISIVMIPIWIFYIIIYAIALSEAF